MIGACHDAQGPGPRTPLPETVTGPLAFVDVSVVSMTSAGTLVHHTVVVDSGRIVGLGPVGTVPLPAGATTVPTLPGDVVMPGLIDWHTHLLDAAEFLLYLANGVTTVRNLHGLDRHLTWQRELEQGTVVGPRLVTSGPILEAEPLSRATNTAIRTPEAAEIAVGDQAAAGFDFIKLYDNVPLEIYRAVGRAALQHGVTVVGHLPNQVGLAGLFGEPVLREVQHLEEWLPFTADGRDAQLVDSIARGLARAGIAVVPTAVVFQSALDQAERLAELRARPEMAYLNPATRQTWGWDATAAGRSGQAGAVTRYRRTVVFFRDVLLPSFRRAGVTILAGSDAPIPMLVPGFALHEELAFYQAAGMPPLEVLRAATWAPGSRIPARHGLALLGTIAPNAPADLLLLSADPTLDVGNLRQRVGVVTRGRWLSQARLQRSLDSLAAAYGQR